MSANAKNSALLKNLKKEKEWHQTLSARCISSCTSIYSIVNVKSLDSSFNSKIHVELNLHADTSVVGSNVLRVYKIKQYVDVYGYDSISRHKNITTANAAVAYKNL